MRALRRVGPAAVPLFLLTGCAAEPVTRQAKEIESLYNATLWLAIVIFAGVVGAILWSIVRYRKQPGDDTLPPQVHGNTTAEVIWTVIPIIIVLILFSMSYATLQSVNKVSADADTAAIIHVRGYQWFWEFDYGPSADGQDRVLSGARDVPELVVPAGETIRIVQTSDNVLHSFFVPNFLFKLDVIPGKPNTFEFRVDLPGTYKGQCAELCGTLHADMVFSVRAVSRAEFDKFMAEFPVPGCEEDAKPATALEITSPPGKIAFDKTCLAAPPNQPVTVKYTHGGGTGAPHNVAIRRGPDPATQLLFGGDAAPLVNDGASIGYKVPALPAGSYTFFCQVHPGMRGEYLVKEGS